MPGLIQLLQGPGRSGQHPGGDIAAYPEPDTHVSGLRVQLRRLHRGFPKGFLPVLGRDIVGEKIEKRNIFHAYSLSMYRRRVGSSSS